MGPSAFSIFSAVSELFVTAAVFYVVLNNLWGRGFAWGLALGVIIFEFSVNMLYMIFRMQEHSAPGTQSSLSLLAAVHGLLSLLVFILFVVLSVSAWSAFKRGHHFFQERRPLTFAFLSLWILSVGSGWTFFALRYL